MWNWFKKFSKKSSNTTTDEKSAKQLATERGEPYIKIVSFELDIDNPHQGSFELDWNDKFVADLIRAGYQLKKEDRDNEIVDRWFQNICRHVVMETWEQEQAINFNNSPNFIKDKKIGNNRSEIS
jgi:hypothetical protein